MDTPFAFQQFVIQQNPSVFKVGTDGVLLGAWCNPKGYKTALDIGTGTGLLSLMLAQQEPLLQLTAIDNMPSAIESARKNWLSSPFLNPIEIIQTALQDFHATQPFDIIISNPPFYDAGLLSPNPVMSQAKHTASLSFDQLFGNVPKLLSVQGYFYVILPFQYLDTIKVLCQTLCLTIVKQQAVASFAKYTPHRILLCISKNKQLTIDLPILVIRKDKTTYSEDYISLTQSFYQSRAYL